VRLTWIMRALTLCPGMAALTPQRSSGHGVSRASDHRIAQPGVRKVFKVPAVFCKSSPTTPRSGTGPSRDKVQRWVVQSQVFAPTSLPELEPPSIDLKERHVGRLTLIEARSLNVTAFRRLPRGASC
jgi:hypothetical protein